MSKQHCATPLNPVTTIAGGRRHANHGGFTDLRTGLLLRLQDEIRNGYESCKRDEQEDEQHAEGQSARKEAKETAGEGREGTESRPRGRAIGVAYERGISTGAIAMTRPTSSHGPMQGTPVRYWYTEVC